MADDARAAFDAVAQLVRSLSADAENIRVVWDSKAGRGVLPIPAHDAETVAEESEDDSLTPTQQTILDVLRASAKPMTRQVIAKQIGWETTGGNFTVYVRDLLTRGLIFEHNRELADRKGKLAGLEK